MNNVNAPSCPVCGGAMYDNRATKKNQRAPDFKCKLHTQGCTGVIWPPRNARPASPAQPGPAQGQQLASDYPRSPYVPANGNGRETRIERQHSQEMAIRMMQLYFPEDMDVKKAVREWTDFFQRDLNNVPAAPPTDAVVDGDPSAYEAAKKAFVGEAQPSDQAPTTGETFDL